MIALLLALTAGAADVKWDLSQRWRHTYYVGLGSLDSSGVATVDDTSLDVSHDPSWYQRTRFSANIADKHMVQLALGTDGQFKRLRQLAATYLGPRFLIGYERGSTPQSFELLTPLQVAEPLMLNAYAAPSVLETDVAYESLSVQYNVIPEYSMAFVGLSVYRFELPTQLNRIVMDARTRFLAAGASGRLDRTRYLLQRGCDKKVCVDPTTEAELFLGFGFASASEDAKARYEAFDEDGPGAMGQFTFAQFQSVGLLLTTPIGERGMLGVEGGASYQTFLQARMGGPQFADVYSGKFLAIPIYLGPHFEVYSRF